MSKIGNNPRRITCATCFDNIVFNDVLTSGSSPGIFCSPFNEFMLLLDIAIANTPTDILFSVEFSEDNVNWFKYMNGPFGDLRYEDAAGNKTEAIAGVCIGKYIRLSAVATGTDGSNTFTVTAHLLIAK